MLPSPSRYLALSLSLEFKTGARCQIVCYFLFFILEAASFHTITATVTVTNIDSVADTKRATDTADTDSDTCRDRSALVAVWRRVA